MQHSSFVSERLYWYGADPSTLNSTKTIEAKLSELGVDSSLNKTQPTARVRDAKPSRKLNSQRGRKKASCRRRRPTHVLETALLLCTVAAGLVFAIVTFQAVLG